MYKTAVRKAKRRFEDDRQLNLEKLMRSPKKWWACQASAEVKRLGLTRGKKKIVTGKVYDKGGVVRQRKEASEVWRRYFERVLNDGGSSEIQRREEEAGGENGLLNEGTTRKEVEQT